MTKTLTITVDEKVYDDLIARVGLCQAQTRLAREAEFLATRPTPAEMAASTADKSVYEAANPDAMEWSDDPAGEDGDEAW